MPENNLSLNISCVLKSLLQTKLFHLSGLQLFPRLGPDCDIIALVFCFRDFSKIRIRNKYALSFFTMASFLSGSLVLPLLYLFLFVKFFETNYRKKINPLVFLRFSFEEIVLRVSRVTYVVIFWFVDFEKAFCVAFFLGSRDFSGKKSTRGFCNVCHRHDQNFDEKFEMCDVKIEEKRWPTWQVQKVWKKQDNTRRASKKENTCRRDSRKRWKSKKIEECQNCDYRDVVSSPTKFNNFRWRLPEGYSELWLETVK